MIIEEYKCKDKTVEIIYGIISTPFGEAIIAISSQRICAFEFIDNNYEELLNRIEMEWSPAPFKRCDAAIQSIGNQIFNPLEKHNLKLLLKGTPFQIKVWRALLAIPFGSRVSYSELAHSINMASATRAAASAIARNHIAYIIPCHRVVSKSGAIGKYRWGSSRKESILESE
ncbi:MAG: methylated-DNA--[protein]-cysteine S-methyltransferase [Rikenellaceae bacterium]